MFTDIVRSTNLVEAIGDEAWDHLLRWHDDTLRSLVARHGGEAVKGTGDGFFVAFADTDAAAHCAVDIQRCLDRHRVEHGFAPDVRIGLHEADATRRDGDYHGRGVHIAARIAALAGPGEILASPAVAASIGPSPASQIRTVRLRGVSAPVDVVAIPWRDQQPTPYASSDVTAG
jgi:class 3 adenylate cyclase